MPELLQLQIGHKYCWRVTAYDPDGKLPFKRGGESDVYQFQYLNPPVPVTGLANKVTGKQIKYTWNADRNHTKYYVEYYDYKRDTTISSSQQDNTVTLTAPEYDYRIKFRVRAECYNDPARVSEYTPWSEAYVQPEKKIDFECGKQFPDREIANQELKTTFFEGEIVESKNGDSRYEIIKATANPDGSLDGKFYAIMDCWSGAKILCDFWDTKINTDNIILTTRYRSEDIPGFVADPEEIKKYVHELVNNAHMAATDNKIRDTILINQKFDYLYAENGRLKAVVVDNNGEPQVTDVTPDKPYSQSLITDGQGDTLVVSKKGQVMGVKEYKFAGDDRHLLNEYHRQLDSLGDWQINFNSAKEKQTYAFDQIGSGNHGIFDTDEYYPKSGNYDFRYKSVECGKNDKVIVVFGAYPDRDSVIFKDKYGVKLKVVDGNILSFTGVSQPDTNYIYAYRGDKKIGKLFLNTYQRKIYNVVLVSVNEAKILHEKNVEKAVKKVEESLNKVYNQCAVSFKITHAAISIDDLTTFSHGGSGILSVYNDDQKKVLQAYEKEKKMEDGVFYLFFIDNVTEKKDGSGTPVSGYMPRGYNAGFIYDGGSPHTIAHELGHGVAGLEHVFENSNASGKTANLMDYANGEELWHFQWDQIQDPSRVWMKWNKDESEGENEVSIVEERNDWDKDNPVFYTPAGMPITIIDPKKTKFVVRKEPFFWTTPDGDIENDKLQDISKDNKMYMTLPVGTLMLFDIGDKAYTARFKGDEFIGYYCLDNNSYYVDTETQKKDWRLVNTINDWSQSWKNGKFDLVEDYTYVPNEDNYEYRGQSISHCYDEILNSYKKNGGSKIVLFNPNRRVVTIINTKELTINDLLGKEIGEEINWSYIKTAYDDLDFVEYTPAEFQENRIMNIPYENRVEILRAISKSRMNAYKEEIALKIVSSIEKDRCDDFIDALQNDNLLENLVYHIDNGNYIELICSIYSIYQQTELNQRNYQESDIKLFIWIDGVDIISHYSSNMIEFSEEKSNSDVVLSLILTSAYSLYLDAYTAIALGSRGTYSPFEYVCVEFQSVPDFLKSIVKPYSVVKLPAFFFSMICNAKQNLSKVEYISDAFTVISACISVGQLSVFGQLTKYGIKRAIVSNITKNVSKKIGSQLDARAKALAVRRLESTIYNHLDSKVATSAIPTVQKDLIAVISDDIVTISGKTITKDAATIVATKALEADLKHLTNGAIFNAWMKCLSSIINFEQFLTLNPHIKSSLPKEFTDKIDYLATKNDAYVSPLSSLVFEHQIGVYTSVLSMWNIHKEWIHLDENYKAKIDVYLIEMNNQYLIFENQVRIFEDEQQNE